MEENNMFVRQVVLDIRTKRGSSDGDISMSEANEILNSLISEGYKVLSAYPFSGTASSVQIYVCLVKQ